VQVRHATIFVKNTYKVIVDTFMGCNEVTKSLSYNSNRVMNMLYFHTMDTEITTLADLIPTIYIGSEM
jgi:hypothetical protein